MNIGQVAERTGLAAKTLRYYEDIKLVVPGRAANGYRQYSEADCHCLTFLGRARSLGFSIDECRRLLALYSDQTRASADVKAVARTHLDDINAKIAELCAMRDTLAHLVDQCAGDGRPDCPILQDFSA